MEIQNQIIQIIVINLMKNNKLLNALARSVRTWKISTVN